MPANRHLAALLSFLSLWLCLIATAVSAGPAMLFEAKTGKLLYAEDMDDQWHPASLTKIMTAYLTFEALKTGKFALETKIPYSEAAQLQPPSKIGLPIGAEISVDMALQSIIIKSANDISVTLAEAIGGTEAGFVEKMNAAAKRLGMSRTHFMNANGLPAPEQVTTARDLGKLARAVVRDYPEYNHYWSLADMRIGRIRIRTHNSVLKTYEGADGLKTGFICDSGYNVVASATREGVRLVAVVLGELTGQERSVRAQALLEHGFNNWGWKALLNTETIDNVPVAAEAKPVASIRTTVMASECGNRRRVARAVAAQQRAKQAKTRAASAPATGDAAQVAATGSGTAATPTGAGKPATPATGGQAPPARAVAKSKSPVVTAPAAQ